MRPTFVFLMLLFVPLYVTSGQAAEDKAGAKRDNFWLNVWLAEREPDMLRIEKTTTDGWQYAQRAEIDEASAKYLDRLMENQAQFNDPYVEDYLTQILHSVVGSQPIYGRPGTPHIIILKHAEPNAFALNNGAIVITTGMLTMIRTEGELKGILAHEVAHVILDHNLENYNSAQSRESLAQFLGIVGAAAGGIVAAKTAPRGMCEEYYASYFRHSMTGAGMLLYTLSKDIMDMVGAAYSRKQEEVADRIAKEYLAMAGIDPNEFGDILFRLGERNRVHGLSRAASLTDDHPTITARLGELAYTHKSARSKSDTSYDRNIAEILTYNASLQVMESNYAEAVEDLDRAIASGWALDDAYVLEAISVRHMADDRKSNLLALELLEQASRLAVVDNRFVDSEKGLIYVRLGDTPNALKAFRSYLTRLSKLDAVAVEEEVLWAKKMIARCGMAAQSAAGKIR